ncbi:MAG: hypothetical protein ACWGMZ_07050 [Thermoguttaceae bacterium]
MAAIRFCLAVLICASIALFSGCVFTSKTKLNKAQTENRILSQQNRAQLAEIENLKVHGRDLENKLISSDDEIAALKRKSDLDRRQLADYERENAKLFEQFKVLARNRADETLQSSVPRTSDPNAPTMR